MTSLHAMILSCIWLVASANYLVMDLYAMEAACLARGPVQASFQREIGVCWNLPDDFPASFFQSKKRSYRLNSCANEFPYLSVSMSAFDNVDCDGEGTTINMDDLFPATCLSNALVSCQENPPAVDERWPSIDMWAPQHGDDGTDAYCNPLDRPHETLSVRPSGATYQANNKGEQFHELKILCAQTEAGKPSTIQVQLFKNYDDSYPYWVIETKDNEACYDSENLIEGCTDCLSVLPPGDHISELFANLVGLSREERVYLDEMTKHMSIRIRADCKQ